MLVSCLMRAVSELRTAPSIISLVAAFFKTLNIFSTLFMVRVVSQDVPPKGILGFGTLITAYFLWAKTPITMRNTM